jgi:hypothetical protein
MSTVDPPPYRDIKTKTVYGDGSISVLQVIERKGDVRTVSYRIFGREGVSVQLIQGGAESDN